MLLELRTRDHGQRFDRRIVSELLVVEQMGFGSEAHQVGIAAAVAVVEHMHHSQEGTGGCTEVGNTERCSTLSTPWLDSLLAAGGKVLPVLRCHSSSGRMQRADTGCSADGTVKFVSTQRNVDFQRSSKAASGRRIGSRSSSAVDRWRLADYKYKPDVGGSKPVSSMVAGNSGLADILAAGVLGSADATSLAGSRRSANKKLSAHDQRECEPRADSNVQIPRDCC